MNHAGSYVGTAFFLSVHLFYYSLIFREVNISSWNTYGDNQITFLCVYLSLIAVNWNMSVKILTLECAKHIKMKENCLNSKFINQQYQSWYFTSKWRHVYPPRIDILSAFSGMCELPLPPHHHWWTAILCVISMLYSSRSFWEVSPSAPS